MASVDARTAMQGSGSTYFYILLVQLCGVKHEKMVVTITPYRYKTTDDLAGGKTEIGDLYVFEDDADAEAGRRHHTLEVFRSRPSPPAQPLPTSSAGSVPPPLPASRLPPRKRSLGEAPAPPASRPAPPPGLPPPGSEMTVLTPRRLSVAEDDEQSLVPVILDGSVDGKAQPPKSKPFTFFGGTN